MFCSQEKVCYNKSEVDALKLELIEKIKQLPNEECKRILSIITVGGSYERRKRC